MLGQWALLSMPRVPLVHFGTHITTPWHSHVPSKHNPAHPSRVPCCLRNTLRTSSSVRNSLRTPMLCSPRTWILQQQSRLCRRRGRQPTWRCDAIFKTRPVAAHLSPPLPPPLSPSLTLALCYAHAHLNTPHLNTLAPHARSRCLCPSPVNSGSSDLSPRQGWAAHSSPSRDSAALASCYSHL